MRPKVHWFRGPLLSGGALRTPSVSENMYWLLCRSELGSGRDRGLQSALSAKVCGQTLRPEFSGPAARAASKTRPVRRCKRAFRLPSSNTDHAPKAMLAAASKAAGHRWGWQTPAKPRPSAKCINLDSSSLTWQGRAANTVPLLPVAAAGTGPGTQISRSAMKLAKAMT